MTKQEQRDLEHSFILPSEAYGFCEESINDENFWNPKRKKIIKSKKKMFRKKLQWK